jgi:glycolate dehydrogenase iron-sulfur subunit
MDITRHYDEIAHCNRCGFCQTACPIFRSTGHESGVARGRLALIRAIIEDRLEWSPELEGPLFDCLLCGACTANCFPAIPTSDLLIEARAAYQETVGRKAIHRLLFDYLLPYPRRLHLAARAVAVGKNSGITRMARAIGLLRIFGQDFSQAEDIIEKFAPLPFRDRVRPGIYDGRGKSLRIGYFVGCGVDIICQEAGAASLDLLKSVGKTVHVLENCCCGLPAWSYGDLQAARNLAEKNLAVWSAAELDLIVTDCSSCASFLKKYPRLFAVGDTLHAKAKTLVHNVRDMLEILYSRGSLIPTDEAPLKVTYHDPCHASRGQGLVSEPRKILRDLPGVSYIELPEADWCCGGAGSYALSHYDLSRKVLDRKMENLKKTGAQVVATSCPACMIHLAYGIRKHGLDVKVKHISEIYSKP